MGAYGSGSIASSKKGAAFEGGDEGSMSSYGSNKEMRLPVGMEKNRTQIPK